MNWYLNILYDLKDICCVLYEVKNKKDLLGNVCEL